MFEKWYLVQISKNVEGGEAKEIFQFDDEKSMWSKFWYQCDKVGTNPSTLKLEMIVINTDGDIIRVEKIDTTKYETPSTEVTE